jgi:hypothetical protein
MENKEEFIFKYFNHELESDEQKLFDQLLKEDEEFGNQVKFEKSVQEALKRNERAELKSFLNGIEMPKETKIYRWFAIAASFVGIVLISTFSIYYFPEKSSSNLYATYFQPYPNEVAPVVRGQNLNTPITDAFQAYENENYKLSSKLFEDIPEDYALLYGGISNLEIDQNQKAINQFKKLSLQKDKYQEISEWYLALAYLKNNETKNAKEVLNSIGQNQQFYEQATELLRNL